MNNTNLMEMLSRIIESGESSKIEALEKLCFSYQIEQEVFEAIKASYDIEKPIPRSVFRTIAKDLERSIEQVSWYVNQLVRDNEILLEPEQKGKSYRIVHQVMDFMHVTKLNSVNGYELAKTLGYSISEIRNAIYREDSSLKVDGSLGKDERGRTIITIYYYGR